MKESNSIPPPQLPLRFLAWFCPESLQESIMGDLLEQYESDLKFSGVKKARMIFTMNVIRFFRPSIILRNKFSNLISVDMFTSNLKITFRNLHRHFGYSAINILGLALGIASCLLIWSYIKFELSFDTAHPDADRLYRVDQTAIWNPEGGIMGSTTLPLAPLLAQEYPEIEASLRINTPGGHVVRYYPTEGEPVAFTEDNVLAADSNFFSFFNFPLKVGDPRTALQGVNKVVISDEAAERLFGDEPALGKTILMGDKRIAVEVTGVTASQSENMHFNFDYLLSLYTNPNIRQHEWSWIWTQVVTYVKVRPDASVAALEEKFKTIGVQHAAPTFARFGINYDDFIKGKDGLNFYLMPVKDIHLHSVERGNRLGTAGDIRYVYILGITCGFILLIAAINFINLSTARSTTRAKEIGVKKALGALRRTLIAQFQLESICISVIAFVLGLALAELLRLAIRSWALLDIPFEWWNDPSMLVTLPFVPLALGFLAGLYPSFYLTTFRPIQVLKGKIASGLRNQGFRNGLVTIQFAISITLLASTVFVFQQLEFMRSRNMGFNKENILVVNQADKLGPHLQSFRDEVSSFPGVVNASIAFDMPGRGRWEDIFHKEGDDTKLPLTQIKIDEHYFSTMGLRAVAGRGFDKNRPSDKHAAILNETAVALFGWTPEEALGKKVLYMGDDMGAAEVIGVVNDFNFQSLRENISPLIFYNIESIMWGSQRVLAVKFSGNPQQLLSSIESKWKHTLDDTPFHYSFLDQELAQQYQDEIRLAGLFAIFTSLSILIAVIGLVGMVAYTVEQRKKEIGVRKVFGASTGRILLLLNKQYIKVIAIAMIIATPMVLWMMNEWLRGYAYKISLNPLVFIGAGIIEITLALGCVSYLCIKAARTNPAIVLKEE